MVRVWVCALGLWAWAGAAAADCTRFTAEDDRYHCLAVEERDADLCQSIRDTDKRLICQAELSRSESLCGQVSESQRARCTAGARGTASGPGGGGASSPTSTGARGTQFQFNLGNPGSCDAVSDPDQRALCKGLAARSEDLCRPIQHTDFRYYCTAVLRQQDSFCRSISEMGLRDLCTRAATTGPTSGSSSAAAPRGTQFQFNLEAPSGCDRVSDAQQRMLCTGLVTGEEDPCRPLQNTDFRYLCTAVVRGQDSYCRSIAELGLRDRCMALARANVGSAPAAAAAPRGTQFQFDLNYPDNCERVTDAQQRMLCQGLSTRQEDYCRPLTHTDFRYLCTAAIRKQDQYCRNIVELPLRETCTRMAK